MPIDTVTVKTSRAARNSQRISEEYLTSVNIVSTLSDRLADGSAESRQRRLDRTRDGESPGQGLRIFQPMTGEDADDGLVRAHGSHPRPRQHQRHAGGRGRLDQQTFLARQTAMR